MSIIFVKNYDIVIWRGNKNALKFIIIKFSQQNKFKKLMFGS